MTTPAWLQACAKEADHGYDPHLLSYHMGWSARDAEVDALKVEAIEQAKTIVLLTEDLQYIAGIVEKGTGSTSKDDLQVRAAILGYVQTLEQENKALKTELEALKNSPLKVVAWLNPMNGVVIDDRKKRQIGIGNGFPNFSEPVYAKEKK